MRGWQGQLQWESSPTRMSFTGQAGEFYGSGGGETGQRSSSLHHLPGSSHLLPGPLGPSPQTAKIIVLPSQRGGGESYLLWRILSGVQVTGAWDTLSQVWVGHPEPPGYKEECSLHDTQRRSGTWLHSGSQTQCKTTGQVKKCSRTAPPPVWEDALLRAAALWSRSTAHSRGQSVTSLIEEHWI